MHCGVFAFKLWEGCGEQQISVQYDTSGSGASVLDNRLGDRHFQSVADGIFPAGADRFDHLAGVDCNGGGTDGRYLAYAKGEVKVALADHTAK